MSSHVTLALTATSPAPTFNHDFYATATAIPVLFLAIAVQPIHRYAADEGAPSGAGRAVMT